MNRFIFYYFIPLLYTVIDVDIFIFLFKQKEINESLIT